VRLSGNRKFEFLSFFAVLRGACPRWASADLTTGMIRESQIAVPQKRLIFHPHAQRNAFRRRDASWRYSLIEPFVPLK
jgi:hypothetical protein